MFIISFLSLKCDKDIMHLVIYTKIIDCLQKENVNVTVRKEFKQISLLHMCSRVFRKLSL